MDKTKILRLEDVTERTGIPRETLRSMRARGRGPNSFVLAGRVCVTESDLNAWLEEQYQSTSSKPAA